MAKVYVLTNESNDNMVLGVYSSMTNATNAMLTYARGWTIANVEAQLVGSRYTFKQEDCLPMRLYIERCTLDDCYLPTERKEY